MKTNHPRIVHLRQQHSQALRQLAMANRDGLPARAIARFGRLEHAVFDYAAAFDPTRNGMYLQQIVRWLEDRAIRFEDGRSTRDLLQRFHADKHRLPVEQRDIGRYRRPADIARILDPANAVLVRDVPDDVMAGSEVVGSGEGWAVIWLNTVRAAVWWSDSTRWCTRHEETAAGYLRQGPFHVMVSARDKYLMHLGSGQLMDRYDAPPAAMPDMPVEAIRAAFDVASSSLAPGVVFHRGGPRSTLAAILRDRSSTNAAAGRPGRVADGPLLVEGNGWGNDDGTILIDSDHGGSVRASTNIRIDVDGRKIVLNSRCLTPLGRDDPNDISHLMGFLRSGAARACGGTFEDGTYRISGDNEISWLAQHYLTHVDDGRLLVHEGRPFVLWVGRANARMTALIVLDIEEQGRHRLMSMQKPAHFDRAPSHVRSALRAHFAEHPSLGTMLVLGSGIQTDVKRSSWAPEEQHVLMARLITASDRSALAVSDTLHAAFPNDLETPASLLRLLSAIRCAPPRSVGANRHRTHISSPELATLHRVESATPPSIEDLLACRNIPLAGLLLAAFPDSECTEEVVDALMAAGRFEVINVMPGRLFSKDRTNNGAAWSGAPGVVSPRIISRSAKALLDSMPFHVAPLRHYMSAYIDNTHTGLIDNLTRLPLHGQSRREILLAASFQKRGWNDFFDRLPAMPVLAAEVEALYEDVPPAGLPWPLALKSLQRSPEVLKDVVAEIEHGRWGDPRNRMVELMALKGVKDLLEDLDGSMSQDDAPIVSFGR